MKKWEITPARKEAGKSMQNLPSGVPSRVPSGVPLQTVDYAVEEHEQNS